ncbi:lipoprotein N-acyltransferase Lnb domain-containing protein [Luteimonas sp. A277]
MWSLLLLYLLSSAAVAAPRIGVATMQPGEIFFERFGHNAIVVDDPALGEPISYNFGFFDMDEPGFTRNFIRGHMYYMLVAMPLSQDLAYYQQVGRGVSIQWMDLAPDQARALAARLEENARPENARYRYDYFLDNCSTRVRDALDEALDGLLATQLQGRSRGNTYRADAVRLASPTPWMWLGFDIGLGPAADRPNSRWQEAFVPMRLAEGLRDVRLADGRPLVVEEAELVAHRLPPEPAEAPRHWWPWLLAGLIVAGAITWTGARTPARLAAAALPFWMVCTLIGVLIAFIWFGTEHRFGWNNYNILLFNPLCLLLLPGAWRVIRGRAPGRLFGWVLAAIAASGVLALFLNWMPVLPQRNMPWICLLLPIHAALWLTLGRQGTRTPVPASS